MSRIKFNPFSGTLEEVDEGVVGPAGPSGPPGPPGPVGGAYRHVQGQPAPVWEIAHNLGYFPGGIAARDSGGELREGYVEYLDSNSVRISFYVAGSPVAFSGEAFIS